MEAITVVSEIGDTWSPNIDPAKIAPMAIGISSSPPNVNASGIAIGVKIDIVPHEVPVANEMNMAMMKIRNGNSAAVINPPLQRQKNQEVRRLKLTFPMNKETR